MTTPLFIQQVPGVSLLKLPFSGIWTGVYLVQDDSKNYLVDSGIDAASVDAVIVPALAERQLKVADIDVLLTTHTHGDHLGGHRRLHELGVRQIACLRQSAEKLRNPLKFSKLIRATFPEDSAPAPAVLEGVEPDFTLENTECIGPLQIFHTPGHDDDCAVFLHTPSRALITGDSLQGNGTVVQGCALYMDLPGYRQSLKTMKQLKPSAIIMGHDFLPFCQDWPDTPGKAAAALDIAMNLVDSYTSFIYAQLKMGAESPREIAKSLILNYKGTIPKYLFLALYTVTEHLRELEA